MEMPLKATERGMFECITRQQLHNVNKTVRKKEQPAVQPVFLCYFMQ